MSTVWQTKHRLHKDRCAALAAQLHDTRTLTPADLEEHAARLLLIVARLLGQHAVDKRGRCRFCGWTRWGRRVWRPRPRCTVFRVVDHAMSQDVDVVWWTLLDTTEQAAELSDVRRRMQRRREP